MSLDLHIHSTASDGSVTPNQIVSMAYKLNLRAISITDHDTLEGSKQAVDLGIPEKLGFIPGVEISSSRPESIPGDGSFHILGYGIRFDDYDLNTNLLNLQKARKNRMPQIITKINELGFELSEKEVLDKIHGNSSIGRPHIAQIMYQKGFVKSISDAFNKYLAHGKPAYINKKKLHYSDAIKMILNAGGIPVLAHPHIIYDTDYTGDIEKLIVQLKEIGLKGIEAYYPRHNNSYTANMIRIARKYELLITGGTDFHGELKPNVRMGNGRGNFYVPDEIYDELVLSLSHS